MICEHAIVEVEVTQVVGGNCVELLQQLARQLDVLSERVAVIGDQLGQDVAAACISFSSAGKSTPASKS